MGTRFMTTKESPLHENYKKLAIEKDVYDTLYSDRFDGLVCRMMDTASARRAMKAGLSIPAAFSSSQHIARELNTPFWKMFFGVLSSGWKNVRRMAFMAVGFKAIRAATKEGCLEQGLLPVGQIQGLIKDEPAVAEVMERIISEARAVQNKVAAMVAPPEAKAG